MDVIEPGSSGRAETDALVEGPKWAGTTITFSFPDLAGYADYGGVDEVAKNFEAFNAVQQAAVRSILTQISSFTGLTFVEMSGPNAANATLRFAMSDEAETAYAYLPNPGSFGGDAWFNNSSGDHDNPMPGNYAWYSLMHEIGHALGLGHPHESAPPMSLETDWMPYTVMSYRTRQGGTVENYQAGDGSFAQTFMREDIAGLQFLYGANASFRAGDTVYRWSETTGEMFVDGVGQGAPIESRIFGTLWDAGGVDTLDLSNFTGSTVRLDPGSFSTLNSSQLASFGGPTSPGNVSLALVAPGSAQGLIENVIAGNGENRIWGNVLANTIHGGSQRDEMEGQGGNDRLLGADGPDLLKGDDGDDWLEGAAGNDTLYGGNGSDQLFGGEGENRLIGDGGDDVLWGGNETDFMDGGEGNDTVYGGRGDDYLGGTGGINLLYGGDGNDHFIGQGGSQTAVGGPGDDFYNVDADDTIIELEGGGFDIVETLTSFTLPDHVEILRGYQSFAPMVLIGNALANEIRGGFNDDVIDGGAGADVMMGLSGQDTFYVDNEKDEVLDFLLGEFDIVISSVSYVLITFSTLYFRDIHIEKLLLVGSNDLNGTGSKFDNIIEGNAGSNALDGKEGNDTLIGRQGADSLIGGAGIDTASYEGDEGGVFVNLSLGRGYGNASFGDTYDSIENVIGTAYNDFVIGDPGLNRLDGAGGDDTIIGAVGADVIVGGAGFDWASYEDNSGVVFINLTLAKGYNNAAEGDTYDGVEHLVGGLMDDFFIGNDGANRLNGAMGADTLLGAGGADVFMFTYAPGATSIWGNPNVDLILDFATGVDRIELSAAAFPGLPVGTLAAGAFWAGTAAHDSDDRILYDAASGKLFFDPDGTGGQAALLFAVLGETSHPTALAASDFVVV